MRRLLLLLATFTAALLVLPGLPAMSTTPAATAEGAATASQAQIGVDGSATGTDPYWPKDGNGGTDAQHYDVRIGYDLASGRLRGRTAVTMTATEDLRSFSLDLLLAPTTVRVDGVKARFKKAGKHELRVKPKQPIATGSQFTVVVTYAGRPGARRYAGERAWLATKREVVAMGQPHMAPWWFPSNDHPSDKATFDVRVTMPKSQQVIGNGVRVKRKVKGSRATTHWRMSDPMATYLAFFAAGRFQIDKGTTAAGIPYYNAVSKAIKPQVRKYAATMLAKSGGITDWLQQRLGSYPFASTGGVVTSIDVGFALENQSRPTYGTWIYPSVIVHELAHQWFGDSVAVQRWRDIWLNEGFATYLEADYVAEHGGESVDAYLQRMWNRNCGTKNKDFWTLDLANPGADDIFDEAVYDRGAVTLAALRHRIGPEQMTTLLRTWVADHRGGNATVEQFIALAETVSGENLDGFFQAWLSSGTTPAATPENGLAGITCA